MLEINYEFRKGLLFVRLSGVLTSNTSKELSISLQDLIVNKGVKYFVINMDEINYIDKSGVDLLLKKYNDVILHDGKLIICCNSNIHLNSIDKRLEFIKRSYDELTAFKLINI